MYHSYLSHQSKGQVMAVHDSEAAALESRRQYAVLAKREKELDSLRKQLAEREDYIESRMQQERNIFAQRETELLASIEQRNEMLSKQEQILSQRREALESRLAEQQAQMIADKDELISFRMTLEEQRKELELEKKRLTEESQKALQGNSKRFVKDALGLLSSKESRFHGISIAWAVAGAFSLVIGVIIAILTMVNSSDNFHHASGAGLAYYFFHLFRGLVVVGLCGFLARYSFVFSKSYMHESLKLGERAHAIRFGEFYLDTYGANAQWEEVKEAFAHWNISGQSAFSNAETGPADPAVVGAATNLVEKAIASAAELGKKSS
ncbi:hypothetical protein [Pseudomonas guariconensis]|uniref:hypothetical protein n=1 Tax=Pseudomonas guariconensis TaxID=1288410 RepID=UPI0018AA567C|nr:hypothetical protein [Pseudomonas guariconensis]MBF8721542.1 hypothetical protein [Pseudomonas guariconensis]